jgi:uncharacterized protein YlxP (DUF503 family)
MHVGVGIIRLRIPENGSLKDKRHVVKSILSQVTSRFKVAAAEVDDNDSWRLATIGISCISNDPRHANEIISNVAAFISETRFEAEILEYHTEIIPVFDMEDQSSFTSD